MYKRQCLGADYESMKDAVEEARDALDIDVIDIFLLHEVRSGQFAERAGAWEYLNKAKTEGLVRAIGVSTHNVDVVREMASVDAVSYTHLSGYFSVRHGTALRKVAQRSSELAMRTSILTYYELCQGWILSLIHI